MKKQTVKRRIFISNAMMVGSLYAIIQGPETLEFPQASLGVENFSLPACLVGMILVLGLQKIKERREKAS